MQSATVAGRHALLYNQGKLDFVNLVSGVTEGEFELDRKQLRGISVSERYVLLFHGSNKLSLLRIAD
jgi:hypothetical protein